MKSKFDSRGKSPFFTIVLILILSVTFLLVFFPLLYVFLTSFASKTEMITRGFFLIPYDWTLSNYGYLLYNPNFMRSFNNSIYITVVGTAINITLTSLMAYGLSKSWLTGRRLLNMMVLFTMLFGGGMIPTYLVVKELHLLNTFWALFLTSAIAPFHLIVMRSFFQNIPVELEESARIDGCSELILFVRIVLPLSMPAVATFTLFYAVHNWNTYFNAILYLSNGDKWPVQVFIRQMLSQSDAAMVSSVGEYQMGPAVKMAAVVITSLPLIIIYPFLQKYFNKGMLLGSVKG